VNQCASSYFAVFSPLFVVHRLFISDFSMSWCVALRRRATVSPGLNPSLRGQDQGFPATSRRYTPLQPTAQRNTLPMDIAARRA